MPEEKQVPEAKTEVSPPIAQHATPRIQDKRILPEGVVPKQAQGYVVAGLAALILTAVLFSKNHARPASKESASVSTSASGEVNQQRIRELEQDLSADQRQGEQQARTQMDDAPGHPSNAPSAQPGSAAPAAEPPRDPIADAEKALAFKARFASNLVFRNDAAPAASAVASPAPLAATAGNANTLDATSSATPHLASTSTKRAPEVSLDAAHGQPYVIFEGTTIDTALVNRLDGEFAGPVKVMVTNPVYSRDRQHVLIPEGTFVLGNAQKVAGLGQKRLAVAFHRMIMPDGYSVDLDQFHGLDQAGETGLRGKVDNHYLQLFGASIALGVIAGAAEATTDGGFEENGSDMYRQGLAQSLATSGSNVLDRFINVPPTIMIREGHRIRIYLTQDLLLPAYENHDMPGVM